MSTVHKEQRTALLHTCNAALTTYLLFFHAVYFNFSRNLSHLPQKCLSAFCSTYDRQYEQLLKKIELFTLTVVKFVPNKLTSGFKLYYSLLFKNVLFFLFFFFEIFQSIIIICLQFIYSSLNRVQTSSVLELTMFAPGYIRCRSPIFRLTSSRIT